MCSLSWLAGWRCGRREKHSPAPDSPDSHFDSLLPSQKVLVKGILNKIVSENVTGERKRGSEKHYETSPYVYLCNFVQFV